MNEWMDGWMDDITNTTHTVYEYGTFHLFLSPFSCMHAKYSMTSNVSQGLTGRLWLAELQKLSRKIVIRHISVRCGFELFAY
jgi:hypothetical protein